MATPSAAAAAAAPAAGERVAEVAATVVNVRTGPGLAYAAVTKALRGTRLTVLGEQGGWVKIVMPESESAWVSAQFVEKGGENIGTLTGDGVNVRSEPAASGQILGQLPMSYHVKIVEERSGWYRIKPLPSTVGWVSAELLRIVSGAPLAAAPVEPAGPGAPGATAPSGLPPAPGATPGGAAPAAAAPSESAKQFEEAEALLKAEAVKPDIADWDVPKLITLYEALAKSSDRAVRIKAENRLSQLSLYRDIQQRVAEQKEAEAKVPAEIQKIDEAYARRQKELEEMRKTMTSPSYVAVGVLRRLAIPYLPPATHKIQGERRILFLLYWPDNDLSPYEGQKVGITGTLTVPSGWETPLIRVSAVHVLEE